MLVTCFLWVQGRVGGSVVPFSSCLQSFPASESSQMSQFFTSGGQSIGALISIKVESTLTSTLGEKVLESDCEGSTEEACRGVLDRVIPPLSLAGPSAHKEAKESR